MKAMKLKKALKKEFSSKRQYKTTYKDIKKYFKILNNVIFDNKLSPFGQIQIKDLKREKCIGQVVTFEWKRKGTRLYKLEHKTKLRKMTKRLLSNSPTKIVQTLLQQL